MVIQEIENRKVLQTIVENATDKPVIIKFGATWCKPCQLIKKDMEALFEQYKDDAYLYDLDIDDSFDVYAYLRSKKQISGVPCVFLYETENTSIYPDKTIHGTNITEIRKLFKGIV